MLTTSPHLRTLRPSPTTAEFTVSTRLIHPQPQRALLTFLLWTARLATLASSFLLLHAKYRLVFPSPGHHPSSPSSPSAPSSPLEPTLPDFVEEALSRISASSAGHLARRLAEPAPVWALVPACLLAAYLALLRYYQTEKLLVLRGLGIQIWSASPTVVGGATTRFIPTAKVRDVLVNEAFLGNEVRFYLIVIVEGEDDVVVMFSGVLPERDIVLEVWNGVRGCLWEGGKNPRWAGKNVG